MLLLDIRIDINSNPLKSTLQNKIKINKQNQIGEFQWITQLMWDWYDLKLIDNIGSVDSPSKPFQNQSAKEEKSQEKKKMNIMKFSCQFNLLEAQRINKQ